MNLLKFILDVNILFISNKTSIQYVKLKHYKNYLLLEVIHTSLNNNNNIINEID